VVPTLALTVLTILAGNLVQYTLLYADARQITYIQSAGAVFQDYEMVLDNPTTIPSIVIASIGALLGIFNLGRS
jgi:hypothetical protein